MKRLILILFAIGLTTLSSTSMAAMSNSQIRKETRFLTDKMAYELSLNTEQYNDAYEINFDFISSIRYVMNDVVAGYEWALENYYEALDLRNDDLRWVMSDSQYRRFLRADYFYRPVYASGGRWNFRIYITYTNHNHFYFGRPYHYRSYCGGHYRTNRNDISFYRKRYNHTPYSGSHSVRENRVYRTNRRSDFGSVTMKPNTSTRPNTSNRPNTSTRPSGNSSGVSSSRESRTTERASSSSRRNSPTNKDNSSEGRGSSSTNKDNSSEGRGSSPTSNRSKRTESRRESTTPRTENKSSSSSESSRRSNSSSSSRSSERSGESSRR